MKLNQGQTVLLASCCYKIVNAMNGNPSRPLRRRRIDTRGSARQNLEIFESEAENELKNRPRLFREMSLNFYPKNTNDFSSETWSNDTGSPSKPPTRYSNIPKPPIAPSQSPEVISIQNFPSAQVPS